MNKKVICIIFSLLFLGVAIGAYFWQEANGRKNWITVYGNVDVRQVDMSFRVFGRVTDLLYEEGDMVQPGQLMALLEKKPYSDQVVEAEANVLSTYTSFKNAEILLKRRCELISSGSVSQEDLDDALTNFEVLAANLKQARAALAVAKKNLADTEMYAPTLGTILTRIREPGSVVIQGEPVYTFSIANPVWVRAFISEPQLGLVYPGMKAEIHTDTPGGKVYVGTVGFISPVSEFTPKTVESTELRTDLVYRIRVYADNPDLGLRQGMPVTVKLRLNGNGK